MKNNLKFEVYFPGFTKKSLTFTIDDGNIPLDKKFLSIVRPLGILGTFNLCAPVRTTVEEYRELYCGYEIANHCKHHPKVFSDGQEYVVSNDKFDPMESMEEAPVIYKTEDAHLYKMHQSAKRQRPTGWVIITDCENYLRLSRESRLELEEIFGKGSIKSFVWPYGEQSNEKLFEELKKEGYNSIRKTGAIEDTTAFSLPEDRMRWSYNATNRTLLSVMEKYEKIEDDGELKFFAFGVHSHDFENDNNWCDLAAFAEKYGNRPDDFYYASVSDIFEYEDAVKALIVTDTEIINNSDRKIYLSLNGNRVIIEPNSKYSA